MTIQALDGVEYGIWPTRSAAPPGDRFTGAREKLIAGSSTLSAPEKDELKTSIKDYLVWLT